MKVFRCEMCGSSELLKTEDLYACKNCGTKYTLENAKKLLIEVDESDKINNLKIELKNTVDINRKKELMDLITKIKRGSESYGK